MCHQGGGNIQTVCACFFVFWLGGGGNYLLKYCPVVIWSMSFTLTVSGLILRLAVVPETDEIDEIKVVFLGRCHIITFPTVCSTVVGGCHSVGVLFLFSTSWVSCCVQTPFVIHTYLRTGSFVPSMLICREAADVATVQMLAVCYLATATICVWECACVFVFRSASA